MHQDRRVIIKGDPSLTKTRVSLRNMMKTCDRSNHGFLVECRPMEWEGSSTDGEEMEEMEEHGGIHVCCFKEVQRCF